MIQFRVNHEPVAQPRPRFLRNGFAYTPKSHPVNSLKQLTRAAAAGLLESPLEGPLRVDLDLVFPRLASQKWKTKSMHRLWHPVKPDRDNCDKAVLDALSGIIWKDDAQICDGRIRKFRAAGEEEPHVLVTVIELPEYPRAVCGRCGGTGGIVDAPTGLLVLDLPCPECDSQGWVPAFGVPVEVFCD